MPPFLVYFGIITLVVVMVSFSIAKLPFGIGAVFREILASWTLLLLYWLVVSILHSFLTL
jgi:hypothetical protein